MLRSARTISPLLRRPALTGTPSRSLLLRPASLLSPNPRARYASSIPPNPLNKFTPPPGYSHDHYGQYSSSTAYVFTFFARMIRYAIIGAFTVGTVGLVGYEGFHQYIEHVALAAPSRVDDDEYGWAGEVQGWTGGPRGGTDPRLGIWARHALRAAWVAQEQGIGSGASSIGSHTSALHPDFVAARGLITVAGAAGEEAAVERGRIKVDKGYELAEEYLDIAIAQAKKKGLVFPATLSGGRLPGPPSESEGVSVGAPQGDPAVVDLLLLKAGVLERMNTLDSLSHAKDIYEQVLCSVHRGQEHEGHVGAGGRARVMRLAGKVGDLCAKTGVRDEALRWWEWGLEHAGVTLPAAAIPQAVQAAPKAKGWFSWGGSSSPAAPEAPPAALYQPLITHSLPPAVLRATLSILLSASAQLATTTSLSTASSIQTLALSYIPTSLPVSPDSPAEPTPAAQLHAAWLRQRRALFKLHNASVLHALNSGRTSPAALAVITSATQDADAVIASVSPIPAKFTSRGSPLASPAKTLERDALLTGAEIAFTSGIFCERATPRGRALSEAEKETQVRGLEAALDCFERAMELSLKESGKDAKKGKEEGDLAGRGEEWEKYWRGHVRVKGKLEELVGSGEALIPEL
ncbi:hypothetical protein IAT38_001058 [Cryptococcus sp. DSM 104549]